jgi:hypothetical protein
MTRLPDEQRRWASRFASDGGGIARKTSRALARDELVTSTVPTNGWGHAHHPPCTVGSKDPRALATRIPYALPWGQFFPSMECDMAEQLLLFASELRARAKEILALTVSTDDLEIRDMRRVIAAGYEKLARRIERRARETVEA